MENDNKYYTPTIEEFHFGFEYENRLTQEDNWFKVKAAWDDLDSVYDDDEHDYKNFPLLYRVKHLDQEDIESLGFNLKHKSIDLWFERPGIFLREDGYHLKNIKLNYGTHDKRLKITFDYTSAESQVHFEGNIKNKSELKKLLTQLGITNE